MAKLELIVVAFALFQLVPCEVRDVHHVEVKLNELKSLTSTLPKEIDQFDVNNKVEKKILEGAAQTFDREGSVILKDLQRGIIDNSQSNEHGKGLQAFLQAADDFIKWSHSILQKDSTDLRKNLKDAVVKFEVFLPLTKSTLENIKESSKNSELATNAIINAVEDSLASFTNIKVRAENRKSGSTEVHNKIQQASQEALNTLNSIPSNSNNAKELVAHSFQLKRLLHTLAQEITELLKTSSVQGDLKTVLEKKVEKLEKIQTEIQSKVNPNIAFSVIQNFFNRLLSATSNGVVGLESLTKVHNDVLIEILLDLLGIIENMNIQFQILSGKIH